MIQHEGSDWCVAMLLWYANLYANAMVGTQVLMCILSAWLLHISINGSGTKSN